MKTAQGNVVKTIVARCERGEDLSACLDKLVKDHGVLSGAFQVVGAVRRGKVGIFERGRYEWLEHVGALEISSCTGNVTTKEGQPFVHAHAVFGDEKGTIITGHVGDGCIVDPTAEIHMTVYDGEIRRRVEPDSGLWVLDI